MLGLLGDEWTLLVIQQALLGATRFAEFKARLPISNSVLTRRLQSLTRDGLLDRRAYQTNPPRSEYLVTPRSRSLWPVLLSIWEWERHWVPDHAERLPGMRHIACGADFAPLLICRSCGETANEKDVVAQWGPSGSWPRSMPVAVDAAAVRGRSARRGGGPVPADDERDGQSLGVRAVGRGVRRREPVHRLSDPARRAARFDRRSAVDLHRQRRARRRADNRYRLTEKGRALFPVLVTALHWAQRWFRAPGGPRRVAHAHSLWRTVHRRCWCAISAPGRSPARRSQPSRRYEGLGPRSHVNVGCRQEVGPGR